MQTVTNKQIYDRWEQIPEALREAFMSIDNGEIIWKACEDAGLPAEVIDNVLTVVGNVICGFTHINDLAKELQSIPGMDPKAVDPIIFQIDRGVFGSIKGDILKLYRVMSGDGPMMVAETSAESAEVAGLEPAAWVRPGSVEGEARETPEGMTPQSSEEPAILRAAQFETRKIKIGEEDSRVAERAQAPIEAPAMIHTESVAAPVASKKRQLSSFGGIFGFARKSSERSEGPAVVAQVSGGQGLAKKPDEMVRTEQQAARVVHYTSAKEPQDIFVQAAPQAMQAPAQVIQAEASRGFEGVPPAVVMKTPQRPEPIPDGAGKKESEPRLAEIPVPDDVVDLRSLEKQ